MFKLRSLISFLAVLVVASTSVQAQLDYTCTKDKQCQNGGCCMILPGQTVGNCGLGPTFCGANCTSTCDAKVECNPGWGSNYSIADVCPLNVCCGQYGYCGTGADYCGATTVPQPSCSTNSSTKRVVAYYEGWNGNYSCNQMPVKQIPQGYFTHLNLAFLVIDPNTYEVAGMDNYTEAAYSQMAALKKKQPGLETWISIGGYAFNDPGPKNATFSNLAASPTNQTVFFKSLISFMNQFGFDGVDIDWEYPGSAERNGVAADVGNFVTFLQNLRSALDAASDTTRLGLTITTPASYYYLKNFDIANIAPSIDWFNVMTYDYHGVWDASKTVAAHTNLTEISDTLDLFWRNDIDPEKVTMGLGFYGRSFALAPNATASGVDCSEGAGCPFVSGGTPGLCTNISGMLSATEIKDVINKKNATLVLDTDAAVMIATYDKDQWISYDDIESFKLKLKYANSKCLGGLMIWAIDYDFDGAMQEGLAAAGKLPRQYSINGTLSQMNSSTFANATIKGPVYQNITEPNYSNVTSLASTASAVSVSAHTGAIKSCTAKSSSAAVFSMASASDAATSGAASTAPASAVASLTAAPAASGTMSSSGSAPSPVQDGASSICTSWYLIQKGDTCFSLESALHIAKDDFLSWNPAIKSDDACTGFMSGFYVCVGVSGTATTITSQMGAAPSSAASAAATS